MKCMECGGELFRSSQPITSEFRGEKLIVCDVEHWCCSSCDEIIYDADDLAAYSKAENAAYRERLGLLSPEEIRAIRRKLDLTQKQFEELLGVSTPTVSRWETGAAVQSKMADNLIRVVGGHRCAAQTLLERSEIGRQSGASAAMCTTLQRIIQNGEGRERIRYARR